ncbi:MAG: D-glycero-beta-D-manno-heptose 1,7-bisphosphate 7-phosphatase [Methanoregula sp.]|uniref:D-glycero-beta-D-manno-heptose 1,7-bisphosphate 7-phosphatase n=1 Tax=Methanoregula sp. TaxID=2052170 RepID=UPI0025F3EA14|nr:D-glycero-beta-D-manno-heptose 1,7-bisphosphate 7-phosphatase [Methanoregula sp.]MCK9630286.1 D-glycero-beta-D-manno-heptose 1,7-bisphosphate 7-phosphatase [Methanoregula sp.]
MNTNKAVFLDRDGVITQDPPHYAHRIDQLMLIEGSGLAIKKLNDAQFKVIVITNQSGVAKGMYEEKEIIIFNREMVRQLKQTDAHIDAIYYCPHHPEAKVQKYRTDCNCRKPKPGMLLEGAKKYNIDFKSSFLVGDKWSDIEAGQVAGCKTVLVKTGHGFQEFKNIKKPVDYIATDLLDAVQNFIL